MSEIDTNDVINTKRHPQGIFLTTSNIGLQVFAFYIKDENLHKIAAVIIPVLVGGLSFLIRRIVKHLECKRGISTYNGIIEGLEGELKSSGISRARKQQIQKEIIKYKNDIIKAKKENIKIFID